MSLSNNNQSNSEPEERQKELTTPDDANSESELDECKHDNRFINALYEKLVAKNAEDKTYMTHDKEEHEEQIIGDFKICINMQIIKEIMNLILIYFWSNS